MIRDMDSVERVERDHVHSVYSQIALHFSDTRYKPWPRVEEFIKSQPPGSFIADVGEIWPNKSKDLVLFKYCTDVVFF